MDASSSSSSSSLPRWNYDVFLSFRGKDTRKNFVDHLYMALQNKGIYTFKDDEKLRRGKSISPELLKAIKESELAIIIFSKNYASSSWCLDELVQIIECKKAVGQKVLPIFYDVDPSQVRKQKGSFAEAFAKHEEFTFGEDKEKVQRWRTALVEAANLSGWDLNNTANGHEAKFIQKIVQEIMKGLRHIPLNVAKYGVGIDSRANKVITLLENGLKDVCIVGICGSGGTGKTTIVKAVFNRTSDQFESCCFLSNVREVSEQHGLTYLQQQLLNILMEEDLKIWNVDYGINVIKKRLRYKKVLVVLDDVDSLKQLESLVGEIDWFGFGSRIIITTRNERLLVEHKVDHEIYNVELLNDDEALQLFSWHAFTSNHPLEEYLKLSQSVINYVQGLPLAIKVLGSFLYKRSKKEWEDELNNLKRIPNREICDILKSSFDGLDDTEKDLFLDISCFFKWHDKDYVMDILSSSGFHPRIQVLIERSLITISDNNMLQMHDLIQEMGKEIVRRESPDHPGKRSRLWFYEDIYKVLRENTVTEAIKGIMLNMPHDHPQEELHINADAFVKMKKLKLLKLSGIQPRGCLTFLSKELSYLDWDGYPAKFFPSNFLPKNLVDLRLCHNQIKEISSSIKFLEKLKFLDLSESLYLYKTPDLSSLPCLERLNLERCTNLIEVHRSFGVHERLVRVHLENCINLRSLPRSIKLKNLEYFDLRGCSKLEKFSEIEGPMDCLKILYLNKTAIKDLPSSIEHLKGLRKLSLQGCSKFKSVPSNIFSRMKDLETLYMGETAIEHLPSSPKKPNSLLPFSFVRKKTLASTSYFQLELLFSLRSLKYLDLRKWNLSEESFPNDIGRLSSLESLDLSGNNFSTIPASLIQLTNLECLNLNDCTSLRTLTSLPSSIRNVDARGCKSLEQYRVPPSVGSPDNRMFSFAGCYKLLVTDQRNNMPNILLQNQLQGIYIMILPGSEIPQWFSHKSEVEGSSSSMSLVVHHHHYNNIEGITVCAVFECHDVVDKQKRAIVDFSFKVKVDDFIIIDSDVRTECWFSHNKQLSNHVMLMNLMDYYDGESKGYQPIKNLMKNRPEHSPGPPNISDDNSYIEASVAPIFNDREVKMKKMGIHLILEEQAQVE